MPWRQLASALRERVALPLRERIALHQARYRYTREEVGRVWITVDGREIAQFDTSSYVRRRAELAGDLRAANGLRPFGDAGGQQIGLSLPWWVWNLFAEQAVFLLSRSGRP